MLIADVEHILFKGVSTLWSEFNWSSLEKLVTLCLDFNIVVDSDSLVSVVLVFVKLFLFVLLSSGKCILLSSKSSLNLSFIFLTIELVKSTLILLNFNVNVISVSEDLIDLWAKFIKSCLLLID